MLKSATAIYLIDWPDAEIPATLVRAGYTVVAPTYPPVEGGSPFLLHEVSSDAPQPEDGTTFALSDGSHLYFRPLDALPAAIDIVSTYRPADEQVEIVEEAIRLGAKVIWVEPGTTTSSQAKERATSAGLAFVEDESIADAARNPRTLES